MVEKNPPLFVRPDYDLRLLLAQAIKLSPDPIIRKRGRAWFPRLVMAALRVYVDSITPSITLPQAKDA